MAEAVKGGDGSVRVGDDNVTVGDVVSTRAGVFPGSAVQEASKRKHAVNKQTISFGHIARNFDENLFSFGLLMRFNINNLPAIFFLGSITPGGGNDFF